MTDRVVTYTLRGNITDLTAKMTAAGASVNKLATDMTALDKQGAKQRASFSAIGASAGKMGLVAAAGLGVMVLATAKFDKQMSAVQAATHASASSMDSLRAAAIKAGADTAFSASEAAQGIEELAKAGVSTADILGGGLKGALDLAAAGSVGVGEAAETAATALTQFNLSGSDVPHVADLLAAAAGKAQGSVSDMGMALKQSGLVASQTGLSIEETTGTLAAFASAGLIGSDAGTSFKTMLQALTPTGDKARLTMDELGITAYDAQGNFIGMAKFAENLRAGLAGLSVEQQNAAMKTIFGADAVRAASVVFQQGGTGIQSWIDKVNDSGYAAETAAIRLDNLSGDMEKLRGSLETALIGSGEGSTSALREMVQAVTALVNAYNGLPGPLKNGAVAVLGLTAALGGTLFVASKAAAGIANLKGSVADMGVKFEAANKRMLAFRAGAAAAGAGLASLSAPAHKANKELGLLTDVAAGAALGFAVSGGPWGAAIGGGAALLGSLGGSAGDAAGELQQLTATLDQQTGAATENTRAWAAKQLIDSGAADTLKDMGISLKTATDAVMGNSDALDEQAKSLGDLSISQAQALGGVYSLSDGVKKGAEDVLALAGVTDQSAAATGSAADEFGGMGTAADAAATNVKSLQDALNGLLDPLLDQEDASNAWKDSIASLTADLRENGATLSDNTVKGRANQDAIRDRVKALKDSVNADAEAGVGQDVLSAKLIRGAQKILAAGTAAGISRTKMKAYLTTLGLTPEQIKTLVVANTAAALSKLSAFTKYLDGMNGKTVKVYVEAGTPGGITKANGGIVDYYADGGMTENHIAQIAPAGAYRVWAEPETGGEAYIPFAMSKRQRSQQIAMETVSRLGGVAYFANGGTANTSASSTPTSSAAALLEQLVLHVEVGASNRTKATWYIDGKKFAGRAAK